MKKNKAKIVVRNYVARNPLLRKGGAHIRAKSGERFSDKQQTRKAAREWQSSRARFSLA
ncbi:hypothetical protein [uncultured Microbulbifer sp.]|uniref:hypothetical protein n=1 Tax=uncultured Microbulbifer sp. TaxID=348147 RepID=UPI0025EFFA64|nr:hypothetical protein [uncultured Microbulbifer sp.]